MRQQMYCSRKESLKEAGVVFPTSELHLFFKGDNFHTTALNRLYIEDCLLRCSVLTGE